jgi:hypothetical protein
LSYIIHARCSPTILGERPQTREQIVKEAMMRTLMLLPVAVLLAACSTPQERAARLQAEMEHDMQVYGPACVRLGFQVNSDPWRNCVLQLGTREEVQRSLSSPSYYAGYGPGYWRGGFWGPGW